MDRIELAFAKYARQNFLPEKARDSTDADQALPIGYDQTNSQPTTVKMMLGWLDAQSGDKVLDVGSGSGWTTALLSFVIGQSGKIYAVERIPELVEMGRRNCHDTGVKNARFYRSGKAFGLPAEAPFDRILVSASAAKLPDELVEQLKPGGKLVIPVGNSIFEIHKKPDGTVESTEHPGFVFVPLI